MVAQGSSCSGILWFSDSDQGQSRRLLPSGAEMQCLGLDSFPETFHLQSPTQGRGSLNKEVPRHGALNCPSMSGFLVVIRKVIVQCIPKAAVPCRKVVAADVVAETSTQPAELYGRKKGLPGRAG